MRIRKRRRHAWNLSFASMSDIAFLLIIFFAVAGKFTRSTEKEVVLPGVDLGDQTTPRDIEIMVTKEGAYYMNGGRVEAESIEEEITSYLPEDADRDARTVVVQADRDARYADVAVAIEAVNRADAYLELAVRQKD
jgi:biopolymer transport protein ExbD